MYGLVKFVKQILFAFARKNQHISLKLLHRNEKFIFAVRVLGLCHCFILLIFRNCRRDRFFCAECGMIFFRGQVEIGSAEAER